MTKRLVGVVIGLAFVWLAWSASAGKVAAQKDDDEAVAPAVVSEENFWTVFNKWEALTADEDISPKNQAKADKILAQLVKGVYLVKFAPADDFDPQTPGEFLSAFYKTSTLKSDKNRVGGSGFFRTKRVNDKLTASFLTEQPDKMKQDIERNPQLVFISKEEVTPIKFVAHVKSKQESIRNESLVRSNIAAIAGSAERVCAPQISKLLKAIDADDYEGFVANGTSSFKAGITPQIFGSVTEDMIPRMEKGYQVQYLGSLKQRKLDISVWKITYKDGGDDTLAKLWMRNGKVAGFLLQ